MSKFTDKDKGYKALGKRIKKTKGASVSVGLHKDLGEHTEGLSIVEIGVQNEFGSGNIPSRPFMRGTYEKQRNVLKKRMVQVGKNIVKKSSAKKELNQFGAKFAADIQSAISSGIAPENAPMTKLLKGGSYDANTTPLIDTGVLRASINWKVEK